MQHTSITCDVHIDRDTPLSFVAYGLDSNNGLRGTFDIGGLLNNVTLFMGPPEIDRMICELVTLRQKVAELAKEGGDDEE